MATDDEKVELTQRVLTLALRKTRETRADVQRRLDALCNDSTTYVVEGAPYEEERAAVQAFIEREKEYLHRLDRIDREITQLDALLLAQQPLTPHSLFVLCYRLGIPWEAAA